MQAMKLSSILGSSNALPEIKDVMYLLQFMLHVLQDNNEEADIDTNRKTNRNFNRDSHRDNSYSKYKDIELGIFCSLKTGFIDPLTIQKQLAQRDEKNFDSKGHNK